MLPENRSPRPPRPPPPLALRPGLGLQDRFVLLLAAVVLGVAVHLLSAGWHVLFGALNPDEGFYAVATRAVAQGEVPYRDFGFTQPPLILYANSVPLHFAGFGLFSQRVLNGVWGGTALLLAVVCLVRRARVSWGLVLALGFSLSAPWMYFVHLGKTYGLTALLVMLATWVFLTRPGGPRRNFLTGLLGVLGVATRLPAAPFFGLLWLAVLWPGRRPATGEWLAALGGAATGLALAVVPFVLAAPENAWFWVVEFHRISVPHKQWHLAWQEIVTLAPAVWLVAALAAGVAVRRRLLLSREGAVFLAAAAALAANLLPRGVYEEYAVPFLLPLALSAALWLHDAGRDLKPALAFAALGGLALVQFGTAPFLLRHDFPDRRGSLSALLTPNAPRYNPALPAQLAAARQLVDATIPVKAPFIGTNLILAAETGRAVPPELRMGPFAYTGELPAPAAARLHLATREQLDQWFARPDTQAVAFYRGADLNYGWSMPSFDRTPDAVRTHWQEILRRNFTVGLSDGQFVILVRKPSPSPAGR